MGRPTDQSQSGGVVEGSLTMLNRLPLIIFALLLVAVHSRRSTVGDQGSS